MKRRSLTGEERMLVAKRLRQRYETGVSLGRLAVAEGYSREKVRRLLVEAGASIRPATSRPGDLTGQERQRVAQLLRAWYEAGARIVELAALTRYSRGKVYDLLVEAETPLKRPQPRPRLRGSQRAGVAGDLRGRYEAGATIRQLAAATGYAYATVHALLFEAGTGMRPAGGGRTAGGGRQGAA